MCFCTKSGLNCVTYLGSAFGRDLLMVSINKRNSYSKKSLSQWSFKLHIYTFWIWLCDLLWPFVPWKLIKFFKFKFQKQTTVLPAVFFSPCKTSAVKAACQLISNEKQWMCGNLGVRCVVYLQWGKESSITVKEGNCPPIRGQRRIKSHWSLPSQTDLHTAENQILCSNCCQVILVSKPLQFWLDDSRTEPELSWRTERLNQTGHENYFP